MQGSAASAFPRGGFRPGEPEQRPEMPPEESVAGNDAVVADTIVCSPIADVVIVLTAGGRVPVPDSGLVHLDRNEAGRLQLLDDLGEPACGEARGDEVLVGMAAMDLGIMGVLGADPMLEEESRFSVDQGDGFAEDGTLGEQLVTHLPIGAAKRPSMTASDDQKMARYQGAAGQNDP